MIFNKKNFKKIIITGTLTLTIVSFNITNAWAYTPIGETYHIPADKNECNWFEDENIIQQYKLTVNKDLEKYVQAPLIKYNPDKLRKAKGKYDDGLRHVYTESDGNQWNMGVGGGNYAAGHISLTTGDVEVAMAPSYGELGLLMKDYNVYGLSHLACDYGHECGHWWYDDAWLLAGQKDVDNSEEYQQELRADAFSIRLVENVPQFSVGGDLIAIHKLAMDRGWRSGQGVHPTAHDRWKKTYQFIKESSIYRVAFSNNSYGSNKLHIKDKTGKIYEITVPPQYDPEAMAKGELKILRNETDRAYYVAGQIAWAIKNNVWNKKHISFVNAQDIFKDFPKSIPAKVMIAKVSNNKWKIIDWVIDDLNGSKGFLTKEEGEKEYNYFLLLFSTTSP